MGAEALTRRDDGTEALPATAADWDDWVTASKTRNHVLGDPLLDWLERHREHHPYTPDEADPRTDFVGFIKAKGIEFERQVVKHLRGIDVGEVRTIAEGPAQSRSLDAAHATFDAMRDAVAIIDQGVIRDAQHRVHGMPDLLIRSDIFAALFPHDITPEVAAVGAPDLDADGWHYVVVDIKYTTLRVTAKGHLTAAGSTAAYAAQLLCYNRALGRLQGHTPPDAYLLGRSWQQTTKGTTTRIDNCLGRVAPVRCDHTATDLTARVGTACEWLRRMRRHGATWKVLPQPSVKELRPNAKADPGRWKTAVKDIVDATEDLSVLPGVTTRRRHTAYTRGLTTWRDPKVTAAALDMTGKTARTLDAVLDINRHHDDGPPVRPAHIAASRSQWINAAPVEFYIDFETVNDLDDNFARFPQRGGQPAVFMIGCGHLEHGDWRYQCFTVDQITVEHETRTINAWIDHMTTIAAQHDHSINDARLIHWASHETTTLKHAHDRAVAAGAHLRDQWKTLRWLDLHKQVIKAEPVTVKGAFDFGLKSIANALHAHGLTKTRWQHGVTDGLAATAAAWWCQNQITTRQATRLTDCDLMNQIRDYNEIDCQTLTEILQYLRTSH